MTSDRIVLVFLIVVCGLSRCADSCNINLASKCPHYSLVNQLRFIPLPDPDHLDTLCSQAEQSLQCILNPSILGKCDIAVRTVFTSILNVIRYPCLRRRPDYVAGRQCWRSQGPKNMMKICYMQHKAVIDTNFCEGQQKFINCTTTDILTLPNCGRREQRVLTAMVVRSFNDNGLVMRPPCPEMTTDLRPSATTTTITIPTTTTTSTTSIVPTSTPTSTMLLPSLRTSSKESPATSSDDETTKGTTLKPTTKRSTAAIGETQPSRSAGTSVLPACLLYGVTVWVSACLLWH